MFIGHYGVSLALKRADPRLSLGGLFLAVQGLDLLFFTFVLLGIEKLRIVRGFTEYNARAALRAQWGFATPRRWRSPGHPWRGSSA